MLLFGRLGLLLAALGKVLVAQGPDPKAILAIPGGQGEGSVGAQKRSYPPPRADSADFVPPLPVSTKGPRKDSKDLED